MLAFPAITAPLLTWSLSAGARRPDAESVIGRVPEQVLTGGRARQTQGRSTRPDAEVTGRAAGQATTANSLPVCAIAGFEDVVRCVVDEAAFNPINARLWSHQIVGRCAIGVCVRYAGERN